MYITLDATPFSIDDRQCQVCSSGMPVVAALIHTQSTLPFEAAPTSCFSSVVQGLLAHAVHAAAYTTCAPQNASAYRYCCVVRACSAADVSSSRQLLSYKELLILPSSMQRQVSDGTAAVPPAASEGNGRPACEQEAALEAEALSRLLGQVVAVCEGLSGRALRELPFPGSCHV